MTTPRNDWQTIDFRPAPPGWRVAVINPDGTLWIDHIAGWLIQELETQYGTTRRAAAAVHDYDLIGCGVIDLDTADPDGCNWKILPPGEEPPSEQELQREIKRRRKTPAA
jgi:hypothetical protein